MLILLSAEPHRMMTVLPPDVACAAIVKISAILYTMVEARCPSSGSVVYPRRTHTTRLVIV